MSSSSGLKSNVVNFPSSSASTATTWWYEVGNKKVIKSSPKIVLLSSSEEGKKRYSSIEVPKCTIHSLSRLYVWTPSLVVYRSEERRVGKERRGKRGSHRTKLKTNNVIAK